MTKRNKLKQQVIIAICGVKNSGKTTLITKLIQKFNSLGYNVATIKHDGHDFNADIEGTDSYKHKQAGAYGTAVFSRNKFLVVKEQKETNEQELIDLFPEADIIFLEGFKKSTYPKIEIIRNNNSYESVCNKENLIAIASDINVENNIKNLDIDKPIINLNNIEDFMKCVKTQDAVGHVLCHDITQIIKDVKKGTAFRKGHIVTEEDIPVLLSLGKDNLYIWEKKEGILHENEAAEYLRDICINENMSQSEVKEGKIEIIAEIDGLLKINVESLRAVNSLGEMMIATRHTNTTVKKGDKLAGTRIIPLLIEQEKMEKAKEVAGNSPILSLMPFKKKKVGIVTTGNEVFYGRIKDTFGPVVAEKVKEFGAEVIGQTIVNDDMEKIAKATESFIEQGADMVLCTGGMSVDPDDKTPGAIKSTGARIVSYGAPVLPGAMMLLAYYKKDEKEIPIVGLPGCVMYSKRTVFDLVLPRLMADDMVTSDDLAGLGLGGLCLSCDICTFPNCGFGKGV